MGHAQLAVSYYNMAISQSIGSKNIRYLNIAYTGLAEHYQRFNQKDSCISYAKKAITVVKNTSFFYLSSKPAQLLTDIYEKNNCDSTLKYSKIFKTAVDSLTSVKTNQQIQLMTFEEDLRQQEVAGEKLKAEEERKLNIQYALITLGIIVLLTLYLLLSRSFITKCCFGGGKSSLESEQGIATPGGLGENLLAAGSADPSQNHAGQHLQVGKHPGRQNRTGLAARGLSTFVYIFDKL